MFVVKEFVKYGRVDFHGMNEEMNDVPSFHETDRLTSDVEYAERMERFRAELVASSGQVLVFVPN